MVAASLVFSVAYSFIKVLTNELGFWQTAFLRGLFAFILLAAILRFQKEPVLGQRKNALPLFFRGFFGAVAMILYFWSLKMTTLANASSLHYTHPLFTTILAVPLLGEKLGLSRISLVFLSLAGVLLIVRPEPGMLHFGSLPALASALFASLAYICIRHVASRENPAAIINSLSFAVVILSLPMTLITWKTPSARLWLFALAAGVLTTLAQYFMTLAYKLEQASYVAAFSFTSILWSLLIGILFFREIPRVTEAFGIFILFGSMVALVLVRARSQRRMEIQEATGVAKN